MVKPTPSRFNPDLLARDSTQYSVTLPLGQFSRLQEFLLDDSGELNATFRFSRRKKSVLVAGTLKTSYRLECQRCLEPMQADIDEPFEFVFTKSLEEAQALPDTSPDPVVLDENGQIHVVDLFEDELILHLPTVARHEQIEECEASGHVLFIDAAQAESMDGAPEPLIGQQEQSEQKQSDSKGERKNPFDVLKNLDLH